MTSTETSQELPLVNLFEDWEQGEVSRLGRRLEESESDDMWDRFAQHPEIAAVVSALVVIVGFLWIFWMNKCALACIIFSIGIQVAFCIFMSVLPLFLKVSECTRSFDPFNFQSLGDEEIDDKLGRERCEGEGGTFRHVGGFQWVFSHSSRCARPYLHYNAR